jgi:hypothetical protein
MKRKPLCALVASLLLTSALTDISLAAPVTPQTTAFSYQGQLNAGGIYPTGQYQFTFTLYDAATGGAVVSGTSPIPQSLQVINGLFTTDLDFGQVFNGTQYWLDIQVGTLDTNEEELVARQPIDVVPVARLALNSPAGTAGPTGATGPQGADGAQGPQGPAGQNGDTGPQGAQGPQGAAGNDGAQGPQGSIGPTGATGLNWQGTWSGATAYNVDDAVFFGGSSYIALVANTNDEPDTSVTNSDGNWELLAQQGATGASGAQGPTGTAGTQGPQGDPGSQGPQGPQGDVGPQGAQGDAGAQGPQGDVGAAGTQGAQGAQGATGAPASGFTYSDIIPANTAAGEGSSNWLTENGVNGTEANAIYIVPANCSSQSLRIVAQSTPFFTYTFTLRHYAGPNNTSGSGTTVASCSITGTVKTCTATGTTTFVAGDGYSTQITGNSFTTTANAIAASLRCQ